jgi:RNA polymerase sigma factor (sigma-70 family)
VIDDDASVRGSLERLLRARGHEVRTYAGAAEFLVASPRPPGCILLDLRMPGMDGLELQRQLGERGGELPIVFLTAHGDVAASVRAMKAGADDFLLKPFQPEALLAVVERALVRSEALVRDGAQLARLRAGLARLTEREREVFALVVTGLQNKEVGQRLGIAEKTVKVHRGRVMEKLRCETIAELVRAAVTLGIESPRERPAP